MATVASTGRRSRSTWLGDSSQEANTAEASAATQFMYCVNERPRVELGKVWRLTNRFSRGDGHREALDDTLLLYGWDIE